MANQGQNRVLWIIPQHSVFVKTFNRKKCCIFKQNDNQKGGAMMKVKYVENINETDNRFYKKPCKSKAQELEKEGAKHLLLSELETDETDETDDEKPTSDDKENPSEKR